MYYFLILLRFAARGVPMLSVCCGGLGARLVVACVFHVCMLGVLAHMPACFLSGYFCLFVLLGLFPPSYLPS